MEIRVSHDLAELSPQAWDRLAGPDHNPFLSHAFLQGLELHGCVGEQWGWRPRHLLVHEGGELVGALPLYLKDNSYGELVFDWAWADAYQRAGGRYYPKLVSAIPYTPVTSSRLLVAPHWDPGPIREALMGRALEMTKGRGLSSFHCLFPAAAEAQQLAGHSPELLPRHDVQFHWHNPGYRDFQDFLDRLNARRRKQIRRERRRVEESRVEPVVLRGDLAGEADWADIHRFYRTTFDRRGGHPTLTLEFFLHLARHIGDRVILLLARQQGRNVAGAFCMRSHDTLYGRHWGCDEEHHSLHFEVCYYQGIDYCIREGLKHFEPGAQGEHKVWRGFEPTLVHSVHWLNHPGFREIIRNHLAQERAAVEEYRQSMLEHLPFRQEG
jgi:predicted N-acyltransferase